MIKTIKTMAKQEKERYNVPRKVQDVIPVRRIWPDGIFLVGTKFTKTYKFTDINYLVASREDKESMFLTYSELLNSLDSGAVTKITIQSRLCFAFHWNHLAFLCAYCLIVTGLAEVFGYAGPKRFSLYGYFD